MGLAVHFLEDLAAIEAGAFPADVEEAGGGIPWRTVEDELVEVAVGYDDAGEFHVVGAAEVGGFAFGVLAVGGTAHGLVVLGTAVAAVHEDGFAILFASGGQHMIHQCCEVRFCLFGDGASAPAFEFFEFEMFHNVQIFGGLRPGFLSHRISQITQIYSLRLRVVETR